MKSKVGLVLILVVVFSSLAVAQTDLYQRESLQLKVDVQGGFDLVADKPRATLKQVTTNLFLFPEESYQQTIREMDSLGKVNDDKITFSWEDGVLERKNFGYSAIVQITNKRKEVRKKVAYPIEDISGYEEYVLPTAKIDADNPAIVAKAEELANGEDDLFVVAFKLAEWVGENVNYDLNELTTEQAQPASWVLQNKEGVCDEMTSLFVAMTRSLGIPARFVSGISYTEQPEVIEELGNNWAGHGWAEVYFPEIGWVAFDITFDEYGYVDVTHLVMQEKKDPDEPDATYNWLAQHVSLNAKAINIDVEVQNKGNLVIEALQLEQEILAKEVGLSSYNLVKGIVKNTADYYAATTLKLAVPEEVTIVGRDKRTLLLGPKEIKETFWIVKLKDGLQPGYSFTFPMAVYSEKNVSVEDSFSARDGMNSYDLAAIESLTVKDEEKKYSRRVQLSCQYEQEMMVGDEADIDCKVKNSGDSSLKRVDFCIASECEKVDLSVGEEANKKYQLVVKEVGWQQIVVRADHPSVEKRKSLVLAGLDEPKVEVELEYPKKVRYGDNLKMLFKVSKNSFNEPKEIILKLAGPGFIQKWELEKIETIQQLNLEIDSKTFSRKNEFTLQTNWKDKNGENYTSKESFVIESEGEYFTDKMKLLFNGFLELFR